MEQLWSDLQSLNLKNASAGGVGGKTSVNSGNPPSVALVNANISNSKTSANNASNPNTRSGTAHILPYCIVLAYRDGEVHHQIKIKARSDF